MDVDSKTMTKMIQAHQKRIENIARQYRGYGLDQEDLVQEGLIGFAKAVQKYNSDSEVPLWGFAIIYVRAAMRAAIGRRPDANGKEQLTKCPEFSAGDMKGETADGNEIAQGLTDNRTPEVLYQDAELKAKLKEHIELLPSRERSILRLATSPEDLSSKEIKRRLRKSFTQIFRRKADAIEYLRQDFEDSDVA